MSEGVGGSKRVHYPNFAHQSSNGLCSLQSDSVQHCQYCLRGAGRHGPKATKRIYRQIIGWIKNFPTLDVQIRIKRHGNQLRRDQAIQVDIPASSGLVLSSRGQSQVPTSLEVPDTAPIPPMHMTFAQEQSSQWKDGDLLRSIWKHPSRALLSSQEEKTTLTHNQTRAHKLKPEEESQLRANLHRKSSRKQLSDSSSARQSRSRPNSPLAQSWSDLNVHEEDHLKSHDLTSAKPPDRPHSAPIQRTRPSISRRQRTQSSELSASDSESPGSQGVRRNSSIRRYFTSRLNERGKVESRNDDLVEPATAPAEAIHDFYRVRQDETTSEQDVCDEVQDIPMHLPSSPLCPQNPKHPSGGTGYCPIHSAAASSQALSYERLQRDLTRKKKSPKTEALLGLPITNPSEFEFHVTPHSPYSPLCPVNQPDGKRLCVLHGRHRVTSASDQVSAYTSHIISSEDDDVD